LKANWVAPSLNFSLNSSGVTCWNTMTFSF
jgi:hypothetical protein